MGWERWWDKAACRTVNPEVFDRPITWKENRGQRPKDPWAIARAVCASCPVQLQCLDFVLEEDVAVRNHGHEAFAAGLEPHQIEQVRRQRESNLRRSRAVS